MRLQLMKHIGHLTAWYVNGSTRIIISDTGRLIAYRKDTPADAKFNHTFDLADSGDLHKEWDWVRSDYRR